MIPAAAVSGLYLAHPARALLLGGPDRPRPARGLRGSKGSIRATSREVVAAKSLVAAALVALALHAPSALADAPDRQDHERRPGAGRRPRCCSRSDFGAGWQGGQIAADARSTPPNCPGFDPKESDLVVTGHADARFSFAAGGVVLDQDVEVLSSAADGARRTSRRTISPRLAPCLAYQLEQPANVVSAPASSGSPSRRPARSAPPTGRRSSCDSAHGATARCSATSSSSARAGSSTVHRDRADRARRPARPVRARPRADPAAAGRSAAGVTGRAARCSPLAAALVARGGRSAPTRPTRRRASDEGRPGDADGLAPPLQRPRPGLERRRGQTPQSLKIPLCPADQPNYSRPDDHRPRRVDARAREPGRRRSTPTSRSCKSTAR